MIPAPHWHALPYSGRTSITGFSPQAYAFSLVRAPTSGTTGARVKRAGYDGVLITGAARSPVQIIVRDDQVTIAPADDLWGLDTFDAEALEGAGSVSRFRAVHRASRRASFRIATITPAPPPPPDRAVWSDHGFEKLKAISVMGSGRFPSTIPSCVTDCSSP